MRFLTYVDLQPGSLAAKLAKVKEAIERDDFKSADVKKLSSGDLYRAKLDEKARLILQFVEHRGERVALALELLPNHEYARSRFLRGAEVDEDKLCAAEPAAEVTARSVRYLHPTHAHFHLLDKPLSFDDAQEAVLAHRPPLILVGSAGSGKTALLLHKMRQQTGRVAYITESAWLAHSARALYIAHGWDLEAQDVDFLSYAELLETVRVPVGRAVSFADFRVFFERHRSKLAFTDAHRCFEEIRGVITASPQGVLTLAEYQALGVRQSILEPEQRAALHAILQAYERYLEEAKLYEPNLVAHAWMAQMQPRYDCVCVDEVQDLTSVQLALVMKSLKPGGGVVVGGDANQIVHPNFFSWSALKSLFWAKDGLNEARDVSLLNTSYRNSAAITDTANRLLKIKHAKFGSIDRESNTLMQAVGGDAGTVRGVQNDAGALAKLEANVKGSTKVAVLVLREEHKEEARRHFRTPLVFSVQEAKGLEYENVILFRLVSAERKVYAELADGVSDEALKADELDYRRAKDKSDKTSESYKFFVNALYVALTRGIANAWIIEDDTRHPLLSKLGVSFSGGVGETKLSASSTEEWQREAKKLADQGKQEQAAAIASQVLKLKPVPWTVMDDAARDALWDKALVQASNKARVQLYEHAAFFNHRALAERLHESKFVPSASFEATRDRTMRKALEPFSGKNFKALLWQVEAHGTEMRLPQNVTPLMLAAFACNVPLVEALLERGASAEARDPFGRQPLHWALYRAYASAEPTPAFGAIYDLLAPASVDVQIDGRLVSVGRELGEYFLFQLMIATWSTFYRSTFDRMNGFSAEMVTEDPFASLPECVVRQNRRKRTYVNHVLARSEAQSTYPSSRKLWVRERQGNYIPNPGALLRGPDGAWRPLPEVLGIAWLERPLSSYGHARSPFNARAESVTDTPSAAAHT